jgi:tripartite-type tricarboxylate transporter receptor subunit TctC
VLIRVLLIGSPNILSLIKHHHALAEGAPLGIALRAIKLLAALATCLAVTSSPVYAQSSYPDKPIKLIVGYPPGGSADFVTRVTAEEISKELGVAVLVDNRPGAGGSIAAEAVSKLPADGYTFAVLGPNALIKALFPKLGFDPDKELVPISNLAVGSMIICVNPKTPFKTLKELIDFAKSHPQQLFSAASGNGSTPHLAAALFESSAGVKFTTIQFKGGGQAAQSTMAGDTQVMFATPPTVMGFIKAGMLRPLAVTTAKASPSIAGIGGAAESGLAGYDTNFSFGLYAPRGTPNEVLKKVFDAVTKGLQHNGIKERFAFQGMDVNTSKSMEAFDAELKADAPNVYRAVKESGAKVE